MDVGFRLFFSPQQNVACDICIHLPVKVACSNVLFVTGTFTVVIGCYVVRIVRFSI